MRDMDYTPRAESVRLTAMAAYLPLVAFFLLASPKHRDVRLIRFHAYQSIGVLAWMALMLLAGSVISTLFGGLPGLGLLINMGVGLIYMLALIGGASVGTYGAVMAYQGNYTSIPVLTDWVWIQVNGSGRPQQPVPGKKRPVKRKRRPRPEDDGAEAIVPPLPPPPPSAPDDWLR